MREPIITENFTLKTQFINAPKIGGVPEDYGRDGKLEAGSPVSLIVEGRIADAASVLVNYGSAARGEVGKDQEIA